MTSLDEARAAATTARAVATLGLLGLSFDAVYWEMARGRAPAAHLVAIGALALLLVALLARHDRPSTALSGFVVLGAVAVLIAALWSADEALARQPRPWVPFQARKLGVLALAMLAPEPGSLGVTAIAAFTVSMIVQYLGFPADVRAHLAIDEPWASGAFGLFALGVYLHRRRLLVIEREAVRAHTEAESLRRLVRVSLAVRDLSNTSLQALRLSAAMLRSDYPALAPRLDPIDRALDRLDELERSLAKYEAKIEWRPGDESFDPITVLESTLADAAPDRRPS